MCLLNAIIMCPWWHKYRKTYILNLGPQNTLVYCHSMAAFQRMHVLPVKQSDMSLPRKWDYQTEGTEWSQCVAICVFQITQNRGRLVGFLNFNNFTFYAPGLKGPPGHLVFGSSVCLSIHLSVIPSRLQTKCNI